MPRKLLEASLILMWLMNDWEGGFDWDTGNEWKPSLRKHTISQIEEAFIDFHFMGELVPNPDENWNESRYSILSKIAGKNFKIAFAVTNDKIRYISHGRGKPKLG